MNCGAAIYGILSADSTLQGLLATSTSIFPDVAIQGAENPCIVYSESTSDYSDTKSGGSKLDVSFVQIDVYTNTIAERKTISERVRTLLDRYSGTVNTIKVQSMQLINSMSMVDAERDTDDSIIYRQSMDFKLRQVIN